MHYRLLGHTGLRVMARALDVAVTAWAALGSGVLTGKYTGDRSGGGGRIESTGNHGMLTEANLAIAGEVVALAGEIGATPSQVALAWVRQQAGVVIPIIGATKVTQLVDNLGSVDVDLTPEQLDRLDRASAIELGFPHDFGGSMNEMAFGEAGGRVRSHR